MSENNPQSISDVEALAAKVGIALTPDDYAYAHQLAELRRQQLEQEFTAGDVAKSGLAAFTERFNKFYPKFLKTLLGIGDIVITLTQTVLIAFGVPLLLIMLMIVEQQRVYHGMSLFEGVQALAGFGASVLVLANLVFELLISWKEHQTGYIEPTKSEFSLRILAQRIAYLTGRTTDWQPRQKSPALRFKIVLRVITFTILVLALAGSMRTIIEQTGGSWTAAIKAVVTDSSLLQMSTWLGGLLFAIAAVLSAQALSQYVAQKVIEVVAIMQSSAEDKPRAIAEATGLTAAMYLYGRLKDYQKSRRMGATVAASDIPQVGVSGMVPVPNLSLGKFDTRNSQDIPDLMNGTRLGQNPGQNKKIDRALSLLAADKTLLRLTLRELQEKYPDIGKNTWATAKQRMGRH